MAESTFVKLICGEGNDLHTKDFSDLNFQKLMEGNT